MGSVAIERAAWRALKKSRRLLPDVRPKKQLLRGFRIGGAKTSSSRPERIHTGYSVDAAVQTLVQQGHTEQAAQKAVARVILRRFRRFGESWNSYISGNGWLHELVRLPEDERTRLAAELGVTELVEQTRDVIDNPYAALSNLSVMSELAQESARLSKEQEQPGSPIRYFLEQRFGLHPELALAVLKYGNAVPWWVLVLLPVMGLLCAGLFVLAIIEPEAEVFQNVGGVSVLHYSIVPLFSLFFFWCTVWLTRDRPRREREWREQLERYRRVVKADEPA